MEDDNPQYDTNEARLPSQKAPSDKNEERGESGARRFFPNLSGLGDRVLRAMGAINLGGSRQSGRRSGR